MTDHPSGHPSGDRPDVGSLSEEARKLFAALGEWARDSTAEGTEGFGEHLATGAPECRYCPICQAISLVRATSPEVRDHLVSSAVSLAAAGKGLLDAATAYQQQSARPKDEGVEHIDLADGDVWD